MTFSNSKPFEKSNKNQKTYSKILIHSQNSHTKHQILSCIAQTQITISLEYQEPGIHWPVTEPGIHWPGHQWSDHSDHSVIISRIFEIVILCAPMQRTNEWPYGKWYGLWGWNALDITTIWISRNWRVLSINPISNSIMFNVIAKVWTTTCWPWGSYARINERVSRKFEFLKLKYLWKIFEIFSTKESTAKLSHEKNIFVCDVRTIPIILSHPRLHQFSMLKMVISNNYDQERNPQAVSRFLDRKDQLGRRSWIPDKTDEPVDLQLSPGHSCPYKTGHPFLTISTNGMQDLAQAHNDQSEHSSSWITANGTLIVFQIPRTSSNQLSTDQITLFLNFGHATSCYKGSPQKCFKIIKNSSKSPIFKEIYS